MDRYMYEQVTFHWGDYVVFAASLALSSAIGIYHGLRGRKEQTTEEFLMAGRKMPLLPVSISLLVSWLSALSILGDPTEAYTYGVGYAFVGVGYLLAPLVVALMFAPVFHRAGHISAYQLLKEKYGVHMRTFGSVVLGTRLMIYMGVALYAPCIAISQITGLKIEVCIVLVGGICTLYTSVGGMKAVLWADTFQFVILLGGLLACVIQGAVSLGGFSQVIEAAQDGGKFNLSLDFSPLARSSIWWYMVGGFFNVFGPYVCVQMLIQRFCTLETERDVKVAVMLNSPSLVLFVAIFTLLGLTMYAYFRKCDPLQHGTIKRPDQMLPLLVMRTLGHLHGMPGLFLASICSAALSTLSSCLSGMAANAMEDAVQPLYKRWTGKRFPEHHTKKTAVGISVLFGVLNIVLGYVSLLLKDTTIFEIVYRISGSLTGPMAAIFVICIIFPWADSPSVIVGVCSGVLISMWIALGSLIYPNPVTKLPVSVAGCDGINVTFSDVPLPMQWSLSVNSTASTDTPEETEFSLHSVYRLSPLLFNPLGFSITMSLTLAGVKRVVWSKREQNSYRLDENCPSKLKCQNQTPLVGMITPAQ